MLVTDAEGASIGDATETAEGSGIFEITVDVGILADGETYMEMELICSTLWLLMQQVKRMLKRLERQSR